MFCERLQLVNYSTNYSEPCYLIGYWFLESDLQAFAEEMFIVGTNIEPWAFVTFLRECICLVQCWIVKRYHWGHRALQTSLSTVDYILQVYTAPFWAWSWRSHPRGFWGWSISWCICLALSVPHLLIFDLWEIPPIQWWFSQWMSPWWWYLVLCAPLICNHWWSWMVMVTVAMPILFPQRTHYNRLGWHRQNPRWHSSAWQPLPHSPQLFHVTYPSTLEHL